MENRSSRRGLALANEETRRNVARKGGQSVPAGERSFSKDVHLASKAGHLGGAVVSQNRAHMSEIGKKGGEARHAGISSSKKEDVTEKKPQG